eukprot:292796-Chlamydomonas_euryale.AAC.1
MSPSSGLRCSEPSNVETKPATTARGKQRRTSTKRPHRDPLSRNVMSVSCGGAYVLFLAWPLNCDRFIVFVCACVFLYVCVGWCGEVGGAGKERRKGARRACVGRQPRTSTKRPHNKEHDVDVRRWGVWLYRLVLRCVVRLYVFCAVVCDVEERDVLKWGVCLPC